MSLPRKRGALRIAALIIGGIDAVLWLVVAIASFGSIDPATGALDTALGWAATIVFAVTSVPGVWLAAAGRAARTALGLALAFPAVFGALVLALVVAFAM